MQANCMRNFVINAYMPYFGGVRAVSVLIRIAFVWACMLAMLAWSGGVAAHAALVSSSPAAGAVLDKAPEKVRLMFNEPVSVLVLRIIQPDGSVQDLSGFRSLPAGLELDLPVLDQQGSYGLSWRVVSADGHPIGGTLAFSVGAGEPGQASVSGAGSGRNFLIWLFRLAQYAGLFLGTGLSVYGALRPAGINGRRLSMGLLALGAGAVVLNVGFLGIDALDMPLAGLAELQAWKVAGATSFGLSALLALVAAICALTAWLVSSLFFRRLAALAALVLLGVSLAASGHASSAPPVWLARPAVWMHALGIVLWVGALLPLARSLQDVRNTGLLRLFSQIIPVVLLALFLSGVLLVYLQLDAPSSLWHTDYGRVLVLKLALLTVLLGLGAYNRYRLTGPVLDAQDAASRRMRRVVYIECLLAVAILAVVALWRFTPPPRSLAMMHVQTPAVTARAELGPLVAELSFVPPGQGRGASLSLQLLDTDSRPFAAQELAVAFSNAGQGIEPMVFSASRTGEGSWHVDEMDLPGLSGWDVRIDVLVSDFERIRLETRL